MTQPSFDEVRFEAVRDAINWSSDIVPPGSEPFVGWSSVLAHRVLRAVDAVTEGRGSAAA